MTSGHFRTRALEHLGWLMLLAGCHDAGPDGPPVLHDQVVFVAEVDGGNDLYLVPRSGGAPTRLTNIGLASHPHVSKDGKKILFGCGADICTVNSDGSGLTHLTTSGQESMPSWSRDESLIAFTSVRDGNSEIYRMAADGSLQTRLTNNATQDLAATWSPNGSLLLFGSERVGAPNSQLFAMAADGSDQRVLASTPSSDYSPTPSHDGQSIAFGSDRNHANQIFIANADGSQPRLLTPEPAIDPAWSSDDQFIAFTNLSTNPSTIAVVRVDGTGLTLLTNVPVRSSQPSFSP